MAAELGYKIDPQEVCARFSGKPARLVWESFCEELNIEFTEELFQNAQNRVHKAFETELKIVDGIFEVFKSLQIPFCVASTTRMESLRRNLEQVGLIDFLEPNIFSASQVERPKPWPDVFLFAAKNMGFEPVSYTHLDVYKRQHLIRILFQLLVAWVLVLSLIHI